ncbi:DUF4350 domain-containing protein [Dendronalium sp. ChiSLP03b]|uniref:DUF4350 domain-containing protein n=1 Tax=Dendronalium sp. ChiSLP03b TaxID=3075381 RepID=UPI002AD50FCF|nr:DUF4350 domain-containing protein [Dendronalium sp. ChiSLP03b]MDZ8209514.1 DUF4350 domain-containing protein [Dendronalium sp. ChiSLP03b]
MKRSNRIVWIGAIALGVIILLTLIAAPNNSKISNGSTYNRAPNGYGAWYAFMQQQGTTIQRWQKPLSNLKTEKSPVTFLQVYSTLREPVLDYEERKWVEKGNTLVILGVNQQVTAADFSTMQKSPFGDVKIETRRRYAKAKQQHVSLGDRFGAVVWEEKYNKGKAIFSTTRYLAANAYQDNLSNFKYLANLVTNKNKSVFVDEYIHGYKDADIRQSQGQGDLLSYFAKTPVLPILVQVGVLLVVLIWAQNRRFGKPVALDTPVVDNSQAYIQALAGVLQKAESSDFVLEMVGKEEQLQLQKALGLGQIPLERQTLLNRWVEKTGASAAELEAVLKLQSRKRRMSERELLSWLGKWQIVRRQL